MSYLFRQAVTDGGEDVDNALRTPLTWNSNAGLVVRF